MSESTVLSTKPGFRLFIGQPEEFPLMQVKIIRILEIWPSCIHHCIAQERSLLLSPGRHHSVELWADMISTDTKPAQLLPLGRSINTKI